MRIPNINCKHYDKFGFCKKKPKERFLLLFQHRQECCELFSNKKCSIADRYPRPKSPPPPPIPKYYKKEK